MSITTREMPRSSPRPAAEPVQIATVDCARARLLRGTLEWPGRLELEESHRLDSPWDGFHESGRPVLVPSGGGQFRVIHLKSANAAGGDEEMARRFARDVASWLHERAGESPERRTVVFAAPRFLGLLRDELGPLGDGIALYRGEFTRLRPGEVAAHPSVRALVGAGAASVAGLGPRPR
ncbi:MAG: hypothetical protein RIS86_912 [Planctomycetota bacterium]|jgi:protein required for attachment to host cells